MPEIKRLFNASRMNRDVDDRLVQAGEYREALNINVSKSEGSDMGAVENLLGNKEIVGQQIPNGKVIGSLRDNGNEKIYYFVTNNDSYDHSNASNKQHAIIEYDQKANKSTVLVIHNTLNFHVDFPITGVNLVDTLLFFTDDRNPPRKINVDTARNEEGHYNLDAGVDNLMSVAKFAPYEAAEILALSNTDETGAVITSNFLENKLVRFSYRYQFDDGEYSVLAPFTPICFSRLGNSDTINTSTISDFGEIETFVNAVKSVQLSVPIPTGYDITGVELIYKETGSSTLYVVEEKTVTTESSVNFFYKSQDPFKTLPADQLTRVSDAVPKKAKSQELAGGRLVYRNFLQNFDIPDISFSVSRTGETSARYATLDTSMSVKSRRTYQVGIVLSDLWGRQSPVILSTHTSTDGTDTVTVGASAEDLSAKYSSAYSWSTNQAAYGQALTITFHDERIVPEEDLYHHETNPHGWYSWRLVVKQQEQDYYNVYTNHPANSWTTKGFTTTGSNTIGGDEDTSRSGRTWLTLYGDNINKVPRSVTESDETRPGIAGCEVRLYPKVVQGADAGDTPSYKSVIGNINQEYMKVISIGSAIEQGLWSDVNEGNTGVDRVRVYKFVRDNDKNPLVAELPNLRTEQVAVTTGDVDIDSSAEGVNTPAGYPKANVSGLTVFETEPVRSKLDIFYETSTGGLLRDLNEQITLQSGGPTGLALSAVTAGTTSAPTFVESENSGKELATLTATASTGSITSYQLVTAVDGNGNDVSSKFIVYNSSGSTWKIKTNGTFAFNNVTQKDTFTLTIKVSQTDGTSTNGDFDFSVTNFAPTITSGTGVIPSGSGSGVVIGSVSAVNGSADTTLKTKFITPGNVTEPSGGATIAGLEIVQPSDGTIRLQTTSSYNETTLFGSNTTKTVTLNITDNGSLSANNTFVITKLDGYQTSGYAASSESSACNLLCIASSMTVYIDEASGSTPSDSGIHYNNIVYTDAAMTNRLYAGSTGWFVWKNNEHAWYVVNGVLNTDNGECDDC